MKTVFVIAMENHNWTQPAGASAPQQIFGNPAAPFINDLVNGTSGISGEVAYASGYIKAAPGVHPSEPNSIWAEAGTNFGIANDDNPYRSDCTPDTVQTTGQPLSAFLTRAGRTWRSYQEDTDVDAGNVPLPPSGWTVPLFSFSGVYGTGAINGYNYSTPDQYNDQHTSLTAGYGTFPAGNDASKIAASDNFLARVVPLIMASKAYKDHGAILLWWDESEGGDTPEFTLPFIAISRDAHPNVNGRPFASSVQLSHSSTLRTMREVFDVDPQAGFLWPPRSRRICRASSGPARSAPASTPRSNPRRLKGPRGSFTAFPAGTGSIATLAPQRLAVG